MAEPAFGANDKAPELMAITAANFLKVADGMHFLRVDLRVH
jgi:hypothetical protein